MNVSSPEKDDPGDGVLWFEGAEGSGEQQDAENSHYYHQHITFYPKEKATIKQEWNSLGGDRGGRSREPIQSVQAQAPKFGTLTPITKAR